jgi:hypothetical protein
MIPPDDLKYLAELYDGFAYALDPFSESRDTCEAAWEALVEDLHHRHAPQTPLKEFRLAAARQCRLWLKKN